MLSRDAVIDGRIPPTCCVRSWRPLPYRQKAARRPAPVDPGAVVRLKIHHLGRPRRPRAGGPAALRRAGFRGAGGHGPGGSRRRLAPPGVHRRDVRAHALEARRDLGQRGRDHDERHQRQAAAALWLHVRDEWPAGFDLGFALRPVSHRGTQAFVQTVSVRWYERLRRRYCVALRDARAAPLRAGRDRGRRSLRRRRRGSHARGARGSRRAAQSARHPGFEPPTGHPLVEETVAHSLARDPTALRGIRPYRLGDPLRAINWRATARSGALHTNEFEPAALAAVRLCSTSACCRTPGRASDPTHGAAVRGDRPLAAALRPTASAWGWLQRQADPRLAGDQRRPAEGALADVLETLARVVVDGPRLRPGARRESSPTRAPTPTAS